MVWEFAPPGSDAWSVQRLASGTYGAGKIVFYSLLALGTAELLGRSVPRYWGWAIAAVALVASLAFATQSDDLQRIYRLQGAFGVAVMATSAWRLHRIDPALRTRGTALMAAAFVLVALLSLPYVLDLRYADLPRPGDLAALLAFVVDRMSVPDLVGQLGLGLAMLALLLDRQAELQRREREAEEALQREGATTVRLEAVGRMAATVAHELNNPLTVVIGTAEQLASQPVDPALKRDLDLLVREAMRCRHVAQELLATTRAEAPPMVEVPTARIVRHATDATRLRASAAGVTLRMHVERGVHVLGDPVALEQAVINLVRNAIDATPRGREVDVRAFADGSDAVLAVEDTGSGIPAAIRDRLFEPLTTTKPVGRGTGLGLAIVRGIVQRHGGTVTLETQPMRLEGTRFVIRLPRVASSWESSGEVVVDDGRIAGGERAPGIDATVVAPAPTTARAAESSDGGASDAARASDAPSPSRRVVPMRALVIDDEPGIREMLGRTLERYGFSVVEAADGIAAQAVLAADDAAATIAVVICDVHMPRLGGTALVQWLATASPALLPRTVLLTGDTSTEELQTMAARLGCQLLAKPFARRDLERVLGRVRSRLGLR